MAKVKKSGSMISPSILAADLSRLGEEVKAAEKAGADWIHIDVMDGRFVPNITMGPAVVKAVKKSTSLPLDVHLMILEPERYIDDFVAAGADILVIHAEACTHLDRAITQIREAGQRQSPARKVLAGVSLNPSTSLSALDYVLPSLDLVLVMSVNPGFSYQKFLPLAIPKLQDLKWLIDDLGLSTKIEVDGGVTVDNIGAIAAAGAEIFVAGNTVYSSKDYKKTIRELKARADAGRDK
jgi:ribulose-phosphate 3-epimerase